ncbi:MAG: DUF1838 domain-containing protein [Steroidobacteraceae bacterium]|jgi:hypothetical protein|nr:DUF1838 domain-containing protein [Steroidobacteraceae bacterium]
MAPSRLARLARRRVLGLVAGAAAVATSGANGATDGGERGRKAGRAPPIPRDDPAFNVLVLGKLQGDLSGATTWIYNPGKLYALRPGQGLPAAEFGQALCNVEGVTRRISRLLPDGSVEERSRNWMFYCDPDSGEYLRTLRNPLTGEMLEVPPYRGSPSGSRLTTSGLVADFGPGFENTAVGRPPRLEFRTAGDTTWVGRHSASRVRGADGGWRNEMSIDAWVCRTRDLADPRLTHIPSTYSWTSFAEWLPWLRMGGLQGNLVWRIEPSVLRSRDELPTRFLARMQQVLPGKIDEAMGWEG